MRGGREGDGDGAPGAEDEGRGKSVGLQCDSTPAHPCALPPAAPKVKAVEVVTVPQKVVQCVGSACPPQLCPVAVECVKRPCPKVQPCPVPVKAKPVKEVVPVVPSPAPVARVVPSPSPAAVVSAAPSPSPAAAEAEAGAAANATAAASPEPVPAPPAE